MMTRVGSPSVCESMTRIRCIGEEYTFTKMGAEPASVVVLALFRSGATICRKGRREVRVKTSAILRGPARNCESLPDLCQCPGTPPRVVSSSIGYGRQKTDDVWLFASFAFLRHPSPGSRPRHPDSSGVAGSPRRRDVDALQARTSPGSEWRAQEELPDPFQKGGRLFAHDTRPEVVGVA